MIQNETDNYDHIPLKILIYGYGNPDRQDDALGILLTEQIESWLNENKYSNITTDKNYQLNIEDAEYISHYDLVIFLDASVEKIDTLLIEPVIPDLKTDFSMHSVTPSFILGLSQQMFNRSPEAYQLHIKGYRFNFMEPATSAALRNLESAFAELTAFIGKYLHSHKD